jgi:hypothetical protein
MMSDADEARAGEGDLDHSDSDAMGDVSPAETTPNWSSRVVPPLLALVSVIVIELRTSRGLSQFLVDHLSPAAQIASQHNHVLDQLGFPSGSELTAVSLPLRLYAAFGALGFGPLLATYAVDAVEVVWLFVGIAWSVRIIQPSWSREVAAVAATVGTIGYALDGNNLANFGFFFGWNYGFASGLACVAIAFALRRRWTAAAIAISVLVAVHFVIAVLVGLVALPLVALDLKRRQFDIRLVPAAVAAVSGAAYLWFARGDVQLPSASLDTSAYVARLRAFQFHLFFEFDTRFLRSFAEDIGAWCLAVVVILAAAMTAKRLGDRALSSRVAITLVTTAVLSMLGWAHSSLAKPNVTLLLMAPHRSSAFATLLLLSFALPLFLVDIKNGRRLSLPVCLIVWCLVHDVDQHLTFGVVLLGLASLWILDELRRQPDRFGLGLSSLALVFAIPALYFTLTGFDVAGGWSAVGRATTRDPATLFALGMIVILALIEFYDRQRRLSGPSVAGLSALAAVSVLVVLGSSALTNPLTVSGSASSVRSDLVDTATWARTNTAQDAIFLLPFDDYGFGWTLFSERASAGKPREWLHYAFLYSRDQAILAEGTRRAELLGIDVDDWLQAHPELGVGGSLVNELTERFDRLSDRSVVQFGDQLDVDYYIFDRAHPRASSCFEIVHENRSFQVAVPTVDCHG